MWTAGLPVVVLLLAGCASAKVERDAPGSPVRASDEAASVVGAIAHIARRGLVGDLAAIEQKLRLKGMTAGLRWTTPPEPDRGRGESASFYAGSESPIQRVVLVRRERYFDDSTDSLIVIFKEGECASFQIAEAAFGMKLDVTMMPQGHGDLPPYPYRSLTLTASDGRKIHVGVEDEGCHIRMSWPSPPTAVGDGYR